MSTAPGKNGVRKAEAALVHFRRILENNNRVMERIAAMDEARGGDYVFDSAFVNESLQELNSLVREVVYSTNALSGHRYPELFERLTTISNHLADLAASGPGPYGHHLVLPLRLIHRDLDHLVGAKSAVLGEAANQLKLNVPDGFTVTAEAYRRCLDHEGLGDAVGALLERRESTAKLFEEAPLPREVVRAIEDGLRAMKVRYPALKALAVRSSAVGEDGSRSFAGQFHTLLNVKPTLRATLAAYRRILASRFSPPVLDYLGEEVSPVAFPMAVMVQTMVKAASGGVCYGRDPAAPGEDTLLISAVPGGGKALVEGSAAADHYRVSRRHPFLPLSSEIVARSEGFHLGDGLKPMDLTDRGLHRGSALLTPSQLSKVAETALLLEKHFDGPQDIEWAFADGRFLLLQSRRLHLPSRPSPPPEEVIAALKEAEVLMEERGHVVQTGIASGKVVHVNDETDPEAFPVGAIAVARAASPRLSPIARKAAAVITDVGSPAGHLATIVREYHTPALFGTGDATTTLPEEIEITLDVEARTVCAGRVEGLAGIESARQDVHLQSSENRILRRLLRWIAPLSLVDPTAPNFAAKNCRTLHDIIRFCHEKAVESILRLPERSDIATEVTVRRLAVSLPIAVSIIDLGGGLAAEAGSDGDVGVEQVRSRPFQPLLSGLLSEEVWDREPAPFGFRDFMGSLSTPLSRMAHPPAFSGENLAIIASDYCNFSLRLGYHFNVIDAFLSGNVEGNYIYFRFIGGFAEKGKRERRAELIGKVLSSLQFKVERQGDLLIGKIKRIDEKEMAADLACLGELVGFTRQLDVRMKDDESVEAFFRDFLEKRRHAGSVGKDL